LTVDRYDCRIENFCIIGRGREDFYEPLYEDTPLDIAPATYISVQKDNQSDLSGIVKLTSKLGFRHIDFGLVTSPTEFASDFDERLCRELESAYRTAEQEELFIELYPTKVGDYVFMNSEYIPAENFVVRTRCDAPLFHAGVRYDGEVCFCCNFGAAVDNVTDKSFLDIWQSSAYNKLREAVNDFENMPNRFRNCWWVNR